MSKLIGIQLTSDKIHPIMKCDFRGRKKMTLATIKDRQDSMIIKFFQGDDEQFGNSQEIGNLAVHNLLPLSKGDVEVKLTVGIDADGTFHANAIDEMSGENGMLSVVVDKGAADNAVESDAENGTEEQSEAGGVGKNVYFGIDPQVSYDNDHISSGGTVNKKKMQKRFYQRFFGMLLFLAISLVLLGGIIYGVYNLLQTTDSNQLNIINSSQ